MLGFRIQNVVTLVWLTDFGSEIEGRDSQVHFNAKKTSLRIPRSVQ